MCPRKTLSIDPIDAAEPSEPSHDEYGKPIGTVTVARNSRMRSTEGYCRSNNQREPKSAAVSGMRQELREGIAQLAELYPNCFHRPFSRSRSASTTTSSPGTRSLDLA